MKSVIGEMTSGRTSKLLNGGGELFALLGGFHEILKFLDSQGTKGSNVVLVGSGGDSDVEEQIFIDAVGGCVVGGVAFKHLVVGKIVDVADHGANGFGVIVVAEVDLVA